MSRVFFAGELDTVATWWRIFRRDGVCLAFTTHDRDLVFGGIRHRAAPGMLPSAIRLSMGLSDDEATVEGALTHAAIREADVIAGRFDGARVEMGVVDWEGGDTHPLYAGTIATIGRDGAGFSAELASLKAGLAIDPIPRTSPSCRASFCGPGCDLNAQSFESRTIVEAIDRDANAVATTIPDPAAHLFGALRFLSGPQAGDRFRIVAVEGSTLTLDRAIDANVEPGTSAILRQGCDRTVATCAGRFANAANFRGEPHLPGADLLSRYPAAR